MFQTLRTINYHQELIEMLFKAKAGFIGANVLVPLMILFIMKDFVPLSFLLFWMGAQTIVFIMRVRVGNRGLELLKSSDTKKINSILKWYLFLIFANAFLLGISSVFAMLYMDTLYTLILITLILGTITGSMSTLTPVFHAVFIFVGTILSIFIMILLFLGATPVHYIMVLLLFFYVTIALPSSFRIYTSINRNIQQTQELKEKNSNFQHLFDSTMEAIIISDENGKIIDSNQAGVALFKVRDKSNFLGRSIIEFVPDYELPKLQDALQHEFDRPRNYDLIKQDGEVFPTLATGRDMMMDGKKVRISVILDLTKIKKQEQYLLEQSRLAQMGEMISMIAHQWRQPLGAIGATTANLRTKLILETFTPEYFDKELSNIETYTHSLTTTIDDFRNFYKTNKKLVPVTLKELVLKSLNIIQIALVNDNIEIIQEYHSEVKMELYDNEMMQVILNILKNAQDNFKEKGTENPRITIRTQEKSLSICDNGGGISDEIMGRIFDPYFSTKHEKNGTGLGLYMSKIIVEEHHNGKLHVKNQYDTQGFCIGICFTIKLNINPKQGSHI